MAKSEKQSSKEDLSTCLTKAALQTDTMLFILLKKKIRKSCHSPISSNKTSTISSTATTIQNCWQKVLGANLQQVSRFDSPPLPPCINCIIYDLSCFTIITFHIASWTKVKYSTPSPADHNVRLYGFRTRRACAQYKGGQSVLFSSSPSSCSM